MPRIILVFASAATATANVAGLPSIARAAREAAIAARYAPDAYEVVLAVSDGQLDDSWCNAEIARLAPGLQRSVTATTELAPAPGDLWLAGEALISAGSILEALRANRDGMTHPLFALEAKEVFQFHAKEGPAGLDNLLYQSGKQIVRGTVKHGDGIVSRYFNRPISTRITGVLLQSRIVRPVQATAVAALTAVVMFFCLISGSYGGLIAGAIFFQVASVIDGVDGEIARATFRTSKRGATLDSLTDAATNLAFLVGLGLSLARQGAEDAARLGMMGFACLSIGLVLLGVHATLSGRPINFDALKHIVRQHQSPLADWVIWLTMRDFLALASAAMVVLGLGHTFLHLFAVGSCLWLLTVIFFGFVNVFGLRAPIGNWFRSKLRRGNVGRSDL